MFDDLDLVATRLERGLTGRRSPVKLERVKQACEVGVTSSPECREAWSAVRQEEWSEDVEKRCLPGLPDPVARDLEMQRLWCHRSCR